MRLTIALLVLGAAPLTAQTAVRSTTHLLASPGGRELATIREGTTVRAASARQGFTQVTLDGYIDAGLVGGGRDSFPNTVRAQGGARLRQAGRAGARILADLRDGMGLTVISRQGDWIRIRRTGWVPTSSLGPAPRVATATGGRSGGTPPASSSRATSPAQPAGAAQPPAPQQPDRIAPPRAEQPPVGAATPIRRTALRTAPAGDTMANLDSGAVVTPLARGSGWTRVRVEGWVRDEDLIPADTALRLSLTAADIRADPIRARGAVVRWEVEFISLQRADALRPDMRANESYILARGPGDESALLYLVVPPSLAAQAARMEALARITVTARVRVGRSEPTGVPILDLLTLVER